MVSRLTVINIPDVKVEIILSWSPLVEKNSTGATSEGYSLFAWGFRTWLCKSQQIWTPYSLQHTATVSSVQTFESWLTADWQSQIWSAQQTHKWQPQSQIVCLRKIIVSNLTKLLHWWIKTVYPCFYSSSYFVSNSKNHCIKLKSSTQ